MRRLFFLMLVGVATLGLPGCGAGKHKQAAEALANDFYRAFSANDWDSALNLYGPEFFEKTTKDQWQTTLMGIREKVGAHQSHEVKGWQHKSRVGTGGSKQTTVLTLQVSYASAVTTETLTFLSSAEKGLRIVGHNIQLPSPKSPPAGP